MSKRGNGEGTIYLDKKRDLWVGELVVGVTPAGKVRRKKVSHRSQAGCQRKLWELIQRAKEGDFDEDKTVFRDAVDDWLANLRLSTTGRTDDIYAGELAHACRFLGNKPLVKITAADVRKMQRTIAEQVGLATAKKVRDRTWGVLEVAYRDGVVRQNVAGQVKAVKVPKKKVVIWSAEEIDVFLEVAKDHRLYPLFYFYLATGARRSEARALRWNKLHFSSCQVDIHHTITLSKGQQFFGPPKTAAGYRTIPAEAELFEVLAKHREVQRLEKQVPGYHDDNLVFPAEDGRLLNSLDVIWKRLRDKAVRAAAAAEAPFVLQEIRIHDLRHTFVSMCIAGGMDAVRIAKVIGHSDPSFTYRTYAHVFEKYQSFSVPGLSVLKGSQVRAEAKVAPDELGEEKLDEDEAA